jgi:hypothetical protein
MTPTDILVQRQGYAFYRLTGTMTLPQAVQFIKQAIAAAREQKFRKLLVEASTVRGFEPPDLVTRYFLVREWAGESQSLVELSLVLEQRMIDPEKFGMTVAANSGMRGDAFTTEAEAIEWLLSDAQFTRIK